MKRLIRILRFKFGILYAKLNHLILTIMVLGILEVGVYYELALSMMAMLAPEIAPIIIIIFIYLVYKGIKKMYENSKNKRCLFI